MESKGKEKKPEAKKIIVSKPFLTGDPYDPSVPKSALLVLVSLFAMAVLYLIVCGVMIFDALWLRVVVNGLVVFVTLSVFYSSGLSQGSIAVNNGEIMYHRRETGAEVTKSELARCYHPLKGFLIGVLGTVPLLLCAIILAVLAKKQITGFGALPSWMTSLETRESIGDALVYYHTATSLGVEGVVRILVRLSLMPYVNMVGATNADGLLLLEHLSPILVLFPGLAYGVGYTQGVKVREKVHTDIARNTRKKARKNQKARKARAARGTIELN